MLVNPGVKIPKGASDVHGITDDMIKNADFNHRDALLAIVKMMQAWLDKGRMIVGHNIINYDARVIEREAHIAGVEFKIPAERMLDTGMLVKAIRLGAFVDPNDTLRSFAKRISEIRARGVYWGLERYCFDAYKLGERAGISHEELHGAKADCILTHHLFEALKEKYYDPPNGNGN
jgi:DNA polymerase III epsilon subunit-like protein